MNPLVYLQCQLGNFHNKSGDESFHDIYLVNLQNRPGLHLKSGVSGTGDRERGEGGGEGLCCSYEVD